MTRKERRKRKKKKGNFLSTLILIIAIGVFLYAGFQLIKIKKGYWDGEKEYAKIAEIAIKSGEKTGEQFQVNFDELFAINPDTVGWIRFCPEPSSINYPIVYTDNNDTYLTKTFRKNENTVGAIFLNAYNTPTFEDNHSIIYGHYMNDGSMFHRLWDYEDKSFYDANPNFYIYTPDGRELTYTIYSVAKVDENDSSYHTAFHSIEEFQSFLDKTKEQSIYDTEVALNVADKVVSLSTCTSVNDSMDRWKVVGVLTNTKELKLEEK